jgi:hypothetical protein
MCGAEMQPSAAADATIPMNVPQGAPSPPGYNAPQPYSAPPVYGAQQPYNPTPPYGGQQPPQPYNAPPGYGAPQPYGAPPTYSPAPAALQCRVCGAALTPQDYQCPRCSTPVGTVVNPNDPTASSFFPVGPSAELINNSGQKSGMVPPPICNYKWHWGAFGANWIWCFAHGLIGWGVALMFLHLIPLFALIASVYLGSVGHQQAWRNRRYASVDQYIRTERVWTIWGVIGFCIYLLIFVLYLLLVIAAAGSR